MVLCILVTPRKKPFCDSLAVKLAAGSVRDLVSKEIRQRVTVGPDTSPLPWSVYMQSMHNTWVRTRVCVHIHTVDHSKLKILKPS